MRIVFGIFGHFGQSRGFEPQIHFHDDRTFQRHDDFGKAQAARLGRLALRLGCRKGHGFEIARKSVADTGTQNLDGQFCAIMQRRLMHLGNGGGGHGLAQFFEQFRNRFAQCLFDDGFGLFQRKRRQAVLQAFQIPRHANAHDIGAGGEKLSEFHIARTQAIEGNRQTLRAIAEIVPLDQPRRMHQKAGKGRQHILRDQRQSPFAGQHKAHADQSEGRKKMHTHRCCSLIISNRNEGRQCRPTSAYNPRAGNRLR